MQDVMTMTLNSCWSTDSMKLPICISYLYWSCQDELKEDNQISIGLVVPSMTKFSFVLRHVSHSLDTYLAFVFTGEFSCTLPLLSDVGCWKIELLVPLSFLSVQIVSKSGMLLVTFDVGLTYSFIISDIKKCVPFSYTFYNGSCWPCRLILY